MSFSGYSLMSQVCLDHGGLLFHLAQHPQLSERLIHQVSRVCIVQSDQFTLHHAIHNAVAADAQSIKPLQFASEYLDVPLPIREPFERRFRSQPAT